MTSIGEYDPGEKRSTRSNSVEKNAETQSENKRYSQEQCTEHPCGLEL